MPYQTPLRAGDPRRVGRYRLAGRLEGIPSGDPIFVAAAPDGTAVAISMFRSNWAHDAAARDRFAAEAAVAMRVPPFCAARVLDAGVDGPDAYLVSEYIAGQSLLELVAAEGVRQGPDLDAVAIGMATGLASVHQAGLVHGNFGPEYVIMVEDGPLRVVEFGITPPYGSATPAADMLAWAQTVVFAAIGRPAASFADLQALPDELRELAELCLSPDPAERPAARAVVQAMLGRAELPAGLLAEGSRRAVMQSVPPAGYEPAPEPQSYERSSAEARHVHAARTARSTRSRPAGVRRPDADGGPATARHSPDSGAALARRSGPAHHQGGRRTGVLVAAALVVVVVISAVVVYLAKGGATHGPTGPSSSPAGDKSPTTAASSATTPAPLTPAAFAGSWSGVVRQPPIDTFHVTVTLATGATSGTVSYSSSGIQCSGSLNLTQASATKLTMNQAIVRGQSKCEDGQVTLSLTGPGTVLFSFRSNGPAASGHLTHS